MRGIRFPLIVVGCQWGDEGKGKIVDLLAKKADYVVRFNGDNNAGHTVVVADEKFKLSLLPSGVLHKKNCYLLKEWLSIRKCLSKKLIFLKDEE